MKKVVIIGTSLNEASKSQLLAEKFEKLLDAQGVNVQRFDLRTMTLPVAGEAGCWESDAVATISATVKAASHIVFAVPIYCYDVNAAAKNIIELIGRALTGKVIGFMCSAGGANSYMSVMGFANHLMLDFRCVITPRFLYTKGDDWQEDGNLSPDTQERLERLSTDLASIRVDGN